MIIYNVTINIDEDIHDHWLDWMKSEHLPEVMATGKFIRYNLFRLLSRQEGESGITYSVQYFAHSMEEYDSYQREFAPALQEKTRRKFEGKFLAFRTLMSLAHSHEKS